MRIFLDTSALVKLYHQEQDSETIQRHIKEIADSLCISEIALLEFRSEVWKKVRTGEISAEVAASVISLFEKDEAGYQTISVSSSLLRQSSYLIMKYGRKGLRTLDAIQLASAVSLGTFNTLCVSSDKLLKELFVLENLTVEAFP
jgi:uncharacterized protein